MTGPSSSWCVPKKQSVHSCASPAASDARAPDASPPPTPDAGPSDAGPLDAEPGDTGGVRVRVTLDGVPMPGTLVMQGGSSHTVLTSSDGVAMVTVDESVAGDEVWIVASHPEARISATDYREDQPQPLSIELSRYDPSDNERYTFTDPGEPARRDNTAQCSHCHQTIGDAWYASPHRTTASNRHVQDVYAGTASVADAASCQALGGVWRTGLTPGTRQPGLRCYVGAGTLPQLNPECAAAVASSHKFQRVEEEESAAAGSSSAAARHPSSSVGGASCCANSARLGVRVRARR